MLVSINCCALTIYVAFVSVQLFSALKHSIYTLRIYITIPYVGQTNQNVSRRMNSHRFDIKNCLINLISHVATHFGSLDSECSLSDFSFLPIDVVNNNLDRLCKETFWIHKLKTMLPNGLNNKLLYDI